MKYSELFTLNIQHEYFSESNQGIQIVPSIETNKILESSKFLVKKKDTGMNVYLSENQNIPEKKLEFFVFPTIDNLREITQFSLESEEEIVLFSNENIASESAELKQTTAKAAALFNGHKAIAKIEIALSNLPEQGVTYEINFSAKAIKWKYYFIAKPSDKTLTITTREEQLNFEELFTQNTSSDKNVTRLQERFPDAQIHVFESETSIPISQKIIKNIKLLQDEEQLIKHLPNPEIGDVGIQVLKLK